MSRKRNLRPNSLSNLQRGHLLSEFLVALGLLFLALVPNLAILNSATKSGQNAALSARGVYLLREGMELAIKDPKKFQNRVTAESFGVGMNRAYEDNFVRRITVAPDKGTGLLLATVTVKLGKDGVESVLERYVGTH